MWVASPGSRHETGRGRGPRWCVSWLGGSLRDCVGTPQICHPEDTQNLEHATPVCHWLCLCEHGGLPQPSEKAARQQGRGTCGCHPVPSGTTPPYPEARREAMRLGAPRSRPPFSSPLDVFPTYVSAASSPTPQGRELLACRGLCLFAHRCARGRVDTQ